MKSKGGRGQTHTDEPKMVTFSEKVLHSPIECIGCSLTVVNCDDDSSSTTCCRHSGTVLLCGTCRVIGQCASAATARAVKFSTMIPRRSVAVLSRLGGLRRVGPRFTHY